MTEKSHTDTVAQAGQVTDAMCEAAIDTDAPDRLQGFSYKSRHVIRDVWADQEIWSAPVGSPDDYQAFLRQLRIERMRKMLEAAMGARCSGSTSVSKTEGDGSIPSASASPVQSCSADNVSLQAKMQQAIMSHPFFEGRAVLAFGLAGAAMKAVLNDLPQGAWQPIATAPKIQKGCSSAKPFLAWCPDATAPDGGDQRIVWWEPNLKGGCWWSDRDVKESPTLWKPLGASPLPASHHR